MRASLRKCVLQYTVLKRTCCDATETSTANRYASQATILCVHQTSGEFKCRELVILCRSCLLWDDCKIYLHSKQNEIQLLLLFSLHIVFFSFVFGPWSFFEFLRFFVIIHQELPVIEFFLWYCQSARFSLDSSYWLIFSYCSLRAFEFLCVSLCVSLQCGCLM